MIPQKLASFPPWRGATAAAGFFSLLCLASLSLIADLWAADCVACGTLHSKRSTVEQAEHSSSQLLAANKAMLLTLSPSDISKKVKISSNVLILAARAEKSANEKILIDQELNAKGCQACPK